MPDHRPVRFSTLSGMIRLALAAAIGITAVTGLSGCATMRAEAVAVHQADWDVLRLKAVRQLGTLIESYQDAKGHYPLSSVRWNTISPVVYIGSKNPRADHQASGFRGDAVVLSDDLLARELSKVLGKPVTLPTDPGPGGDGTKPTYYRYRVHGQNYELSVYTDTAFPFSRPEGAHRNRLIVGSDPRQPNALYYQDLMEDDGYILASTRPTDQAQVPSARQSLIPASPGEKLLFAIANDDLGQMRQALAARAPINPTCDPGDACNPLSLAARVSDLRTVGRLLEAGADPNAVDGNGDTALLLGANHYDRETSVKIRQTLLKHGANPNLGNRWGWTPFAAFSAAGELLLMDLALEKGADINRLAPAIGVEGIEHGDPALVAAVRFGQYDAVRWLLKRGADTTLTGYDGKTARQVAKALNNRSILNLLAP